MLEAHSQMALISNTSVRNQTSAADTRPRTGQRVTWCECYLPARAITKLHCSVTRATKCDNLAYVTISPGVKLLPLPTPVQRGIVTPPQQTITDLSQ